MDVEVDAQPRIDTLVTDATSGEQRRRTEYIGTVWIDGRAQVDGMLLRRIGQPGISTGNKDTAFYVPDSLPYRREALDGAQLTASATLQGERQRGIGADRGRGRLRGRPLGCTHLGAPATARLQPLALRHRIPDRRAHPAGRNRSVNQPLRDRLAQERSHPWVYAVCPPTLVRVPA